MKSQTPGMVARADVAAICAGAITSAAARNTTFEIVSRPADSATPATTQFNTFFDGLRTDMHDVKE